MLSILNKVADRVLVLCLSISVMAVGYAHELSQTSAQVILRDGQVEVRLLIDIGHWQVALEDPTAWLTGETDLLMANAELPGVEQTDHLANYLATAINLQLEQQSMLFTTAGYTSYSEEDATQRFVEFRFSAQHSFAHPQAMSVQFPSSLGEVHISVVQPLYGLLSAGELRTFTNF